MLGCASCSFFFLEPNPFEYTKLWFTAMLSASVWLIYTADHLIDGFFHKGKSGILRYDFHYRHRFLILTFFALVSAFIVYKAFILKNELFIKNSLYLACFIPVYFVLKFLKFLNPEIKMLFVSAVFSVAVVLVYNSQYMFKDLIDLEVIAMILLAFLNQLVLEHFEHKSENQQSEKIEKTHFDKLAKRVFIWLTIILCLISLLNFSAIAYTLSIFFVSLFVVLILQFQSFFKNNLLYRFGADFFLILMFPLLKLFLFLLSLN